MARDKIEGNHVCQTRDAKWLCLNNIYNHFQRPNFYDIGGTYLDKVADFWFLYKTEQVSNMYILHVFVYNYAKGTFCLSLCNSNDMTVNEHTNSISLKSFTKVHRFENIHKTSHSYLTTYTFSELDIESMKDRILYISIAFHETTLKEFKKPVVGATGFICSPSSHDFRDLISDPVGADFTIVSADGVIFPVHKLLLSSRSEVFKAMLKDDTAESIRSSVTIDDVSSEGLRGMIEFLYTGTITDFGNVNWFTLLLLGDRYDLKGLKELAQHALAHYISNEDALETLMAAEMFNCATLKTNTLKYIKTNIACLDSSVFQEINNIHLVQELCKYLAMKH